MNTRPTPICNVAATWATALALTLSGCATDDSVPSEDGLEYHDEVVFELLRHPDRREVEQQPVRGEVRVESVAVMRAMQRGNGVRPSIVIPAGGRVLLNVPALGPGTELTFALGVTIQSRESHRDTKATAALATVRLEDELVVRERLAIEPDMTIEERDWKEHRIAVPDGGVLELEVASKSKRRVEVAIADLNLEQSVGVQPATSSVEDPNLVVIVVDTLRSDRLGLYGYDRPTSPTMDALGARGVTWTDAWSVAPWTWPSTASIVTGVEPYAHGVLSQDSCSLPESVTTLGEHLRAAGFENHGLSTNPLIGPGSNFDQGFDTYEVYPWERAAPVLASSDAFLDRIGDRRFGLYLHITEPHQPFEPEPEERERFMEHPMPEGMEFGELDRNMDDLDPDDPLLAAAILHANDLYDAEVACADRAIAHVVDKLDALGLLDRTLIVVTADHGEELMEHGRIGHSHQLFRESVIVPLIAAGPGLPEGRRIETPVQNHRLLPSVLEWLGLPGDPETLPEPLPLGAEEPRVLHFSTEVGSWIGDRGDARLLGRRFDGEFFLWMTEDGRWALYDTEQDPLELQDRSSASAARFAPLSSDLGNWLETTSASRPAALSGGESTRAMLEAIGYIDEKE